VGEDKRREQVTNSREIAFDPGYCQRMHCWPFVGAALSRGGNTEYKLIWDGSIRRKSVAHKGIFRSQIGTGDFAQQFAASTDYHRRNHNMSDTEGSV
jgi:hypothetical protein